MIIPNGTIEVKQKTCGGIDPETGYARRSSDVVWSDPIPCQTLTNKYNALALSKQGNPITSASYSVLIDVCGNRLFFADVLYRRALS